MAEKAEMYAKAQESKKKRSNFCKRSSDNNSSNSPADRILHLQRTAGNQAVQRLIRSGVLQAKLRISQPNDMYEQEADRVAEQVMRMPEPEVQRKCANCDEDEKKILQAKMSAGQVPVNLGKDVPSIVHEVLSSPSQPLDSQTSTFMEPRFGYDLSGVQVHADDRAAESARVMNARAYTVGRNVVFDRGQYAPATASGQRLLAHELTHVLQQTGSTSTPNPMLQRQTGGKEAAKEEKKPAVKFKDCNTDQQKKIEEGIALAKGLASRALEAFERYIPLSYEQKAMTVHFGDLGSDQKSTIIKRYKHVRDNVESKTYTCSRKGKKIKEGNTKVELCGEASCPGSQITLFPDIGKNVCPIGAVILHEAAHNAEACDDVDKGSKYPPGDSETNAYSYEYCALDIAAGLKTPELPKRKPKTP